MAGAIMAVVGVLIAGGMVVWAVVAWHQVIRHVRLQLDGVLWLEGGRWRGARREEIEEVYRTEIYVNGTPSKKELVVKAVSGVKGAPTQALSRWGKLAEVIQMRTTLVVGPVARRKIKAGGGAVTFGPVEVSA